MKNTLDAQKGDILAVVNDKTASYKPSHYMVYLEANPRDNNLFIGAMLTHSCINGNIPLQKDHFIEADINGKHYKVTFDKSLVANHPLYKKIDWLPFEKVGQLTPKGIKFIENNIAPYDFQFIANKLD